jgi:gliding motility-associated-like protein
MEKFIKLLPFVLLSLLGSQSFTQTMAERYTVSSAGGETSDASGNTYMYDIGGVVVSTTTSGNEINLTQGFEQGDYRISDIIIFNPPNAFSPDGDGVNDYWIIPLPQASVDVVIFNRWGDEVNRIAEYDNMNNVWDGTYQKSGEPVTDGTYFYIVETEEAARKFSGWIQVVR